MSQANSKYCLIEKWPNGYRLPGGAEAVALSSEAVFALEHQGVPYKTLENYYEWSEVVGDAYGFLDSEMAWVEDFNQWIKNFFPEAKDLNLDIASTYYHILKHVVDDIIFSARVLRKFVTSTGATHIWFMGSGCDSDFFDHRLSFHKTESPYSRLIESVCHDCGVEFNRIEKHLENVDAIEQQSNTSTDHGQFKRSLKKMLPKSFPAMVFKTADQLQYLNFWAKAIKYPAQQGRIFLARTNKYMYKFCLEMKEAGFELYFREDGYIKKFDSSPLGQKIELVKTDEKEGLANLNWSDLVCEFARSNMIKWVNDQCGLDVSRVTLSRLQHFVTTFTPETIKKVKSYMKFYQDEQIDAVVNHMVSNSDDYSALLAAEVSKGTKRIGFCHGADAYECPSRYFFLNRLYDVLFLSSEKEAEFENEQATRYGYDSPKVYCGPYYRKKYVGKYSQEQDQRSGDKPIVLFVPILCTPWPVRKMENSQPVPMVYLPWHRALAEYFSTRDEYTFIWKAYFRPGQNFDVMAEIIRREGYSNVEFHSGSLTSWFKKADRILCDVPSAALFEATYSGIPVMSLYRSQDQVLRANAREEFGKSLRGYDSIEKGLRIVERFLDSPRETYVVPFEDQNVSVSEIIKSHLGDGRNQTEGKTVETARRAVCTE